MLPPLIQTAGGSPANVRISYSRRWFLRSMLAACAASASGCGSILYPERVGQPRRGPLDWKVVVMDGACLLLFFVPGVVAFAVDWYNGTLFLPAHQCRHRHDPVEGMVQVDLGRDPLTQDRLEAEILKLTGQRISLADESVRVLPLSTIDQFDLAVTRLETGIESPLDPGMLTDREPILRAQSPPVRRWR